MPFSFCAHTLRRDIKYPTYDAQGTAFKQNVEAYVLSDNDIRHALNYSSFKKLSDAVLLSTSSTSSMQSGEMWRTNIIGPFTTRGSEWATFSIQDLFQLHHLQLLPVGITAHVMTATYQPGGEMVPSPPLYIHHSEPSAFSGYVHGYVITQAGDWQCAPESGLETMDCLGEDYGEYIKLLNESLSVSSLIHDIRPVGNIRLSFWYEFSIRLTTDFSNKTAVSMLSPIGLGDRSKPFHVVVVPTASDSYHYYTGVMPVSGKLIFDRRVNDFHAHKDLFDEAWWLAASPKQLGIGKVIPSHTSGCNAAYTWRAGFSRNAELKKYLAHLWPLPICISTGSMGKVGRTFYPRGSETTCSPWTFMAGDPCTSVIFMGPTHNWNHSIFFTREPEFGSHSEWDIYYVAGDNRSHFAAVGGAPLLYTDPEFQLCKGNLSKRHYYSNLQIPIEPESAPELLKALLSCFLVAAVLLLQGARKSNSMI